MLKSVYKILFTLTLSILPTTDVVSQSGKELILKIHPIDDFYIEIGEYLTVLPDPTQALTIEKVSSQVMAGQFVSNENQWLHSPIKTHWLRLEITNNSSYDFELLSYLQGSVVDLFVPIEDGRFSIKHSGLLVPFSERDQKNRFGHLPYISFLQKGGEHTILYWRISTEGFPVLTPHTNLPASLSSFGYAAQIQKNQIFLFIFVCSMLFGIGIYHLIIFTITREKLYFSFALFSLSASLFVAYFKGFVLELILPELPALHYTYALMLIVIGYATSLLIFVRTYLKLNKWLNKWDKVFKAASVYFIGCAFLSIFIPAIFPIEILMISFIVLMVLLEALGFVLFFKKHPLATNYIAAFSLFTLGSIVNAFFALLGIQQGIWDFGDLGLLGLQILLAVGLAHRIRILNQENQTAQSAFILQLERVQLMQLKANEELEKKVEERTTEIAQQNEKLTRLNLLKNKLFSIISHDVKSPLNQLSGTLYLMERDMISKEEIKTVIPKIRENLSNKSNFLSELFIWARSQMEGVTLKQVSLDMRLLIENNHALLQPTADLKEIRLINRVDQPLYVFADEEMVKTVLRNLVSNAIKFTRQGGEVLTSAWQEQDWVTVFVKDNGLGVSPKEADNLFTPQIHSTTGTDNEVGTGIGLLICKDFVEANGGKIWLEQSDDNGSTFAFTLPTGKAPN